MDIAGILRRGTLDNGVHQTDGRCGRSGIIVRLPCCGLHGLLGGADAALHFVNGAADAFVSVEGGNGTIHSVGGGDHGDDTLLGSVSNFLDGDEVQRIHHGQIQLVAHHANGHHSVLSRQILGHQLSKRRRDIDRGQINGLHAQLQLQHVDQLLLGDHVGVDQHLTQTLLLLGAALEGFLQLLLGDHIDRQQNIA